MTDSETIDMLVDRVSVIKCHECHSEVDVSRALSFSVVKCPKCNADLPVPALLGNFVLFKTIGKGAMGAVYQGFDQTLKRHVAIKVILQQLGDDPSFVDNFIREAQALAALNHVNVVQIYSCGKEKGQPYIVMEMVNGHRLDELMASGPMDEKRVLEVAIDVANGLKAANEIGLVHGDIKPQNILLDGRGTAKVVDFGLARSAQEEAQTSEIWGTPYYIAPEKARRQKEDHRADIYCLGATLFHALAGRPPFEGETAKDVVIKRLQEPAPHLQDLRPEINDETDHLIARMLEADPYRRYPTYDSMHADLNRALEASKRGPRIVTLDERSKGKGLKIFVFTLLLLGLAGGWFFWQKKSPEPVEEAPKGRMVTKIIGGKMVSVFEPYEEGEEPSPSSSSEEQTGGGTGLKGYTEVILSTKNGKGADTYIESGERSQNFGKAPVLEVNHQPSPGAKAYLRFDCSALNLFKCRQPSLRITLTDDFLVKDGEISEVRVWGVPDVAGRKGWEEGEGGENKGFTGPITWNNAPGNSLNRYADLLKGQSELLATYTIDKTIHEGSTIEIKPDESENEDAFLAFLQDDGDKVVTLAVTIEEPDNITPLSIASREHPSMSAPELKIFSAP